MANLKSALSKSPTRLHSVQNPDRQPRFHRFRSPPKIVFSSCRTNCVVIPPLKLVSNVVFSVCLFPVFRKPLLRTPSAGESVRFCAHPGSNASPQEIGRRQMADEQTRLSMVSRSHLACICTESAVPADGCWCPNSMARAGLAACFADRTATIITLVDTSRR